MKTRRNELKWALIFVACLLLWMLLEKLTGLHDRYIHLHQYITLLYAVVAVLIYVLSLREKRKHFYNGSATYGQLFKSGVVMTFIITLLSPFSQWMISEVISPDYFKNVITYSVKNGYYDTFAEAKAEFNLKSYIITSSIWALVMGVITTAIVALFIKNKK